MTKNLVSILIVCLLVQNGFSQINPMEDVMHVKAEKGLMKIEVTTTNPGTITPYLSKIIYYNDDGYESNSLEYNSKGDTTKHSFIQYLGNGLELTIDYEQKDGKATIDSVYEKYNEKNLLVYDVYLLGPEEPSLKDSTIYSYDKYGNLAKTDEVYWKYKEVHQYKNNKIISTTTTDGDVEEGEKPETYISETYTYSENDRKIENKSWIGKNHFYSKAYYILNEKYLPTQIEVYEFVDNKTYELSYKRISTYYENGNLKHETIENYSLGTLKWAYDYSYNENGLYTTQIYSDRNDRKTIVQYTYYYK